MKRWEAINMSFLMAGIFLFVYGFLGWREVSGNWLAEAIRWVAGGFVIAAGSVGCLGLVVELFTALLAIFRDGD